MTLRELYDSIGASYDSAIRILRVEKLIDKHIRKFPAGGVVDAVLDAGRAMDAERIFETTHAMKGVCGNLGLTALHEAASELTEEFRPGAERRLTDAEVAGRFAFLEKQYKLTVDAIRRYCGEN